MENSSPISRLPIVRGSDTDDSAYSIRTALTYIFAIREFLVDNFQMDSEIDKRWSELEALNKIRNCLAHDRGILGEQRAVTRGILLADLSSAGRA
ncbi:MAG: hypothetical protein C0501_14220 [Isosphaera sp.]|nr:hypothetical protein [Isosphaera sp.]